MDNITRPLTQRLTRRLVFDLELLHYDSGTGGGGGLFTDDLGRSLSLFSDDLGRRLSLFSDDLGRQI